MIIASTSIREEQLAHNTLASSVRLLLEMSYWQHKPRGARLQTRWNNFATHPTPVLPMFWLGKLLILNSTISRQPAIDWSKIYTSSGKDRMRPVNLKPIHLYSQKLWSARTWGSAKIWNKLDWLVKILKVLCYLNLLWTQVFHPKLSFELIGLAIMSLLEFASKTSRWSAVSMDKQVDDY